MTDTEKKWKSAFWARFTNAKGGCVFAENEEQARAVLVAKRPDLHVSEVLRLPYPAWPYINPEDSNGCPSFCYKPERCAGGSCRARRACDD